MAVGQMGNGSGCHDLLAAHCECIQCGQNLSGNSYERRVAHVKRCADRTKQRVDSKGHSQDSKAAASADMHHLPGWDPPAGADSGHSDAAVACVDASNGVEGILARFGLEAHLPAFHKEEVDIRALPELSDEDLIYLGVSDTSQRRKLLQMARALKKNGTQRPEGNQSTVPALQPAEIPAASKVAQCTASATSAARSASHDSKGHPKGSRRQTAMPAVAAVVAVPILALGSSSCKAVKRPPQTEGEDGGGTAGPLLVKQACPESQHNPTGVAGGKRSAGSGTAVLPQSNGNADVAEQPEQGARPPPRKFAKLSRSMLCSRKMHRPISTSRNVSTAAAAARQHLSAGSSLQDPPRTQEPAELQGTGEAQSVLGSTAAAEHRLCTGMGLQDVARHEHAALPARAEEEPGNSCERGPPSSKPGQSLQTPCAANQPGRPGALPGVARPKQATGPGAVLDTDEPGSAEVELQPSDDQKPAAYLSGALGHLLAARSVRACISQNGSYSRQAELRLLQALYPGEAGQPCSSADRHQHRRRSADAWSSDDEETARREADPPPSTGFTIRGAGVQQVSKEASLWAMSRQDSQQQYSVPSVQQRQLARKAVKIGAALTEARQPAQKPQPSHVCAPGPALSATSIPAPLQTRAPAGGGSAQRLLQEEQLQLSSSLDPAGSCTVHGTSLSNAVVHAKEGRTASLEQKAAARNRASPNKALRVQSLRQELIAAEAVVAELKAWLADAEAELKG